MKVDQQSRTLISSEELAQRWGISVNTVRSWVCQRRIPYHKLGRLVKFNIALLESDWLKSGYMTPIEHN